MAILVRNIDGSSPWTDTNNAFSCRVTYEEGDTDDNTLLALDKWLSGFYMATPTASVNVEGQVSIKATETLPSTIPTSGTIRLWDTSALTGYERTYTLTHPTDTFTLDSALATDPDVTWTTADKIVVVGHYGDTGWEHVSTNGTDIYSYRALNLGATPVTTVTTNAYKYMILNCNTAGRLYCTTVGDLNDGARTTGNNPVSSTNLTSTTNDNFAQRFNTGGAGEIAVSASQRHFMLLSYYGTTVGSQTGVGCGGCVEMKPENSLLSLSAYSGRPLAFGITGRSNQGSTPSYGFGLPLTLNNVATSTYYGVLGSYGCLGMMGGSSAPFFPARAASGVGLDIVSGKNRVSSLSVTHSSDSSGSYFYILGKIYNVMACYGGTYMDQALISMDANRYFFDANGDEYDYLLFPGLYNGLMWAVPK